MALLQSYSQAPSGFTSLFHRRPKRAAALLVTVLIIAAAATIALVLVQRGLDSARTESNRSNVRVAQLEVENLRNQFEQKMQEQPMVQNLLDSEGFYINEPNRTVKVTLPGNENTSLKVEYAVKVGSALTGIEASYLPGALNRPLLTSVENKTLTETGLETSAMEPQAYASGNSKGSLMAIADNLKKLSCDNSAASSSCFKTGEDSTPNNVKAWMVVPSGNQIEVYFSEKTPVFTRDCATSCDVYQNDKASFDATNTSATTGHPAKKDFWTLKGSYPYPSNGVMSFDKDLYVGYCGASVFTNAVCESEGDTFKSNISFLAGDVENPSDIYFSSSIKYASEEKPRLSFNATGSVFFPYFAHSQNGKLTVEATISSLGLGTNSPLATIPLQNSTTNPNIIGNFGSVEINGALFSQSLVFNKAMPVSFNIDKKLLDDAAPYASTSVYSWTKSEQQRLTPEKLATLFNQES